MSKNSPLLRGSPKLRSPKTRRTHPNSSVGSLPELELGRKAISRVVQNLCAGFVPPEPPNRPSRDSANAARVFERFRAGRPGTVTHEQNHDGGVAGAPELGRRPLVDAVYQPRAGMSTCGYR